MVRKLGLVVLGVVVGAQSVWAYSSSSSHYLINEGVLGASGSINGASSNYSATQSVGPAAVGNSSSTNYQSNGGYETTSDPALTFTINSSSVNFGNLSQSTAATGTVTFNVIDYTSYGYIVQVVGAPPSTGTHTLSAITSAATSAVGTEQFGINLRANTSPASFGTDPSGGFGAASSGYGTINNYQYNNGDTIAASTKTSPSTSFTISYIVNVAATTQGGSYTGNETLICTGTY